MVQILPILGAAALLAQTAFGAAVPVRRTQYSNSNNNNNNNYESSNNNQYNSNSNSNNYVSQNNQYQQGSNQYNQDSNQYSQNSNQYNNNNNNNNNNQYNQDSNQYAQQNNQYNNNQYNNNQQNNQYQATTTESMMMMEATSTAEAMSMETTMAQEQSPSYNMPSYGSGSSSWGGYNDCVSQCMAQFGAPPSAVSMDSNSMPESTGTGAVHTVMVAPDGVGLRYVPFAVNASVGDTIRYVWTTPLNHTVTLSSALAICNKSALADERNFASGVRNAASGTQTFDVTVETAEPQFFYCSVAQHCVKGMFGVINPGSDFSGANTPTVGTMMASMLQENPQLQAANEYIRQNVTDRSIQNWGNDISLVGFSQTEMTEIVSNVMFTRAVFGANPGMLDLGRGAATPDGSPVMIPQGLNVLLSNTATNAPATTVPANAVPTPTGTGTLVVPLANGAFSAKGGASIWAAAFVGVLGYLLI